MKKKKILIIMPCGMPVPAVHGGAVATLIETLIKCNELYNDIELSVITNGDDETKNEASKYSNTKFQWFKMPKWLHWLDTFINKKELIKKLFVVSFSRSILRCNNYDIVVLQNSGFLLKIFKDKSIVQKYKDKIYYHLHNDIPSNADKDVLSLCKFILISNYLKRRLCEIAGEESKDRCILLQNCINTEMFMQDMPLIEKNEIRRSLNLRSTQKVAVFVGRIEPYKGILEVLKAFQQFQNDEIVLVVIGSSNFGIKEHTPFEREIQTLCQKYKERIRFTGFIHNSSIWKYYKIADVAVLPSLWEEPAGLTMIEAAASGTPLITTLSGGIQEYINPDKCICLKRDENLVDGIRDSIFEVCNNQEKWQLMAAQEQNWVITRFNNIKYYRNFIKIFK